MRSFRLMLFVLLLPLMVQAQQVLPMQIEVDHASFALDEEAGFVEVYLSVRAASLPFQRIEETYHATLLFNLVMFNQEDAASRSTPEWQDTFQLNFVLPAPPDPREGQQFLHQVRVRARPGTYQLQLIVPADQAMRRPEYIVRREVVVPAFNEIDTAALSDVTLSNLIQQSQDETDTFFKNGLVVRPNVAHLFGNGVDYLFYYAEAYHPQPGTSYDLHAYLSDASRNQPLPEFERRVTRQSSGADVLVGSFNVATLPTGPYFLRLALLDQSGQRSAEQVKKFFVVNPGVPPLPSSQSSSVTALTEYDNAPEQSIDETLQYIRLVASNYENRQIRALRTLEEKRTFLREFWTRRENESHMGAVTRRDFYQRFQQANERYSLRHKDGWRTDRGRVLVRYGTPSNIDQRHSEQDSLPFEVWHFNNIPGEIEGIFVFVDRHGFGDFELIHSNLSGEPKSASWQQQIRREQF